jgi:ligand-binding sensor domain-containing protein
MHNESRFERYIDAHALVNGWLKNYRNQYRTSFSAPYLSNYTDEVVHFPDYLIATTDGRYLFVEVKSDISSIDRNQNEKSNAIKDALSGTKAIGMMVFGRDDGFYFKTENGVEAFEVLLKSDFKSDLLDSNLEKAFVDGNETVFDLMDRLSSKK